jgi:hypothetical protein
MPERIVAQEARRLVGLGDADEGISPPGFLVFPVESRWMSSVGQST